MHRLELASTGFLVEDSCRIERTGAERLHQMQVACHRTNDDLAFHRAILQLRSPIIDVDGIEQQHQRRRLQAGVWLPILLPCADGNKREGTAEAFGGSQLTLQRDWLWAP